MNSTPFPHPVLQRLVLGGLLLMVINSPLARADSWQRLADVPGRRAAHSAVWTGNEMIVWGGGVDGQFLNTGARYTPSTDRWQVTSPYGAPSARWFHAAVWTGSEMIVWGGRPDFFSNGNLNDGARYDPKTDTWTPISTEGAPTRRSQCAAGWTGSEMIIWGGETEGSVPLADGAAYNPVTDTWRPISAASGLAARTEPTAVWTGSEMIVFGGVDATQPGWLSFGDGARYNPFTDTWTPLPADGAPSSRTGHTAVWTGERMIVWGGRLLPADVRLNDGATYNPGSDTWIGLSSSGAPEPRQLHAAVWTGTEMIIWGGETSTMLDTGARLNPVTGIWTPTTQENAPGKRMFWRPDLGIWTGRGMLVCAGSDYPASLDSTAIYFPIPSVRPPPVTTDIMIRFDPPSLPGGSRLINTWTEAGFNFVTGAGRMGHADSGASTNLPGNGTAYLQFGFGQQPLIISSLSGQPFGLKRVDLAEYSTVFPVPKTVTFTGYHTDGSTTAQSFTTDGLIDGSGPLADFETFTFPASFTDLVRVELTPYGYSLDNLLVSVATNAPPPPPPRAFDLSRDYSLQSNPNGPWSYGYLVELGGSFGLLHASRTFSADNGVPIAAWELETYHIPGVWKVLGPEVAHSDGNHFTAEPGTVYFAPGADGAPQNFGVVRFTVPAGGQYRIETSVRSLFDQERSRDSDFHVLRNGRELFGQFLPPNSATSYSNVLTLAAGDTVDFAIGRGADGLTADTGLKIQAALTPLNVVTNPPPPPRTNCVPAPDGLVSSWAAENNANDLVGTNRGVLLGGTRYAAGEVGRAFWFSAPSNGVKIAASPELDVGLGAGMTIELWINPDDVTESGPLVEWNNGVDLWGAHFWILPNQGGAGLQPPSSATAGPGQLYAAFTLQGQWYQMISDAGVLAPHTFQHVAVTYDKSTGLGRIYRNGSLVAEQTLGVFTPQTSYDLYLGRRPSGPPGDPQGVYHGLLDEVSIYNRALTAAEILSIHAAGAAGKCATNPPPQPPPTTSFDLSRDYSLAANPNGPWSYGYLTALRHGSFGLLGASRTFSADNGVPIAAWELETYYLPGVWKVLGPEVAHSDGDHFTAEPGTVYFAPGLDGAPQNFGAIRFTIPAGSSGQYRVETSVRSLFDYARSRDADFHVLKNGEELFGQFLAPNSATSYSNVLTLVAGDTIDFAIGRGADGLTADTGLKIQASLTPLTRPTNPPPARATYDLRRDYSTNENPNGVWSFGWKSELNGPFTLFIFHDTVLDQGALIDYWLMNEQGPSSVYHNAGNVTLINNDGQGVYPPGTVWFGPGYDENPDNFSIIRFTVPGNGAGAYAIETTVRPALDGPISGDTDFHVLRNGAPLFERFLPPNAGTSYSNVVELRAGDTIDFACGRGRDGQAYASALKIDATLRFLAAATNPPPLRVYEVSRGFSPSHNPNGVWSYGYQTALGGELTLLTYALTSFGDNPVPVDSWSKNGYEPVAVYHNGTTNTSISDGGAGSFPPGSTWFYPGVEGHADNYGVIRFTVPTGGSGIYQLQTAVRAYLDGPRSGDTDFHVLKNGAELFGEFIAGNSGASYSNRLSLAEGDTIDFAVGRGQDHIAFDSGLKIQASIALIAARPLPPPRVFDVSTDYSLASNPNGPWSYGHVTGTLNGPFGLVTIARTFGAENGVPIAIWQQIPPGKPWVAKVLGPDTAVSYFFNGPAGTVYFGPDPDAVPENFGVIRFTTPLDAAGRYRLETAVKTLYDGPRSADADFHVLKNGEELFGHFLAPNSGTNYSNILPLAAGDTVDFIAGRGVNALANTGLKIQATLTGIPENRMSIDRILPVTDGACRVIGHAPPGAICHIERSKNLLDWNHAGFAVATNEGVFEFIDLQSPPGSACFYRASEIQP